LVSVRKIIQPSLVCVSRRFLCSDERRSPYRERYEFGPFKLAQGTVYT
jgi:hypothetical protein